MLSSGNHFLNLLKEGFNHFYLPILSIFEKTRALMSNTSHLLPNFSTTQASLELAMSTK